MAKLNVVIPAVDVEVIGEGGVKTKYQKVARDAKKGDIIRITDNDDSSYVVEGAFYTVEYLDGADDPQILDEDGDEYDAGHIEYEVYEKVTEPAAPASDEITFEGTKYRRVDRSAEEGDVILITKLADEDDAITTGGLYRVESLDWAGDPQITDDGGDDFDTAGTLYEVYERVTEQYREEQKQLYKEVKRPAKVGERIKIVKRWSSDDPYENGDTLTVISDAGVRRVYATMSNGRTALVHATEYVVLEPSGEPAQPKFLSAGAYVKVVREGGAHNYEVGSVVKITDGYKGGSLFNAERPDGSVGNLLADDQVEPATEAEFLAQKAFKVGDYVKVTDACGAEGVAKVGDIGEVTNENWSGGPIGDRTIIDIKTLDGREYGMYAHRFVRAKEAEIEAAKEALDPRSQFAKGDKVRLISGGQGSGLFGFNTGEIYEVTDPKTSDWESKRIQIGGRCNLGFALPNQLEKVSAEEIAEIERKQAEAEAKRREELKWRAIGRKVGEFKRGDIVKVIRVPNGVTNGHKEGAIGEVVSDTIVVSKGCGNPHIKVPGVSSQYRNNAVIIVPVEQRFDREQVETAQAA